MITCELSVKESAKEHQKAEKLTHKCQHGRDAKNSERTSNASYFFVCVFAILEIEKNEDVWACVFVYFITLLELLLFVLFAVGENFNLQYLTFSINDVQEHHESL